MRFVFLNYSYTSGFTTPEAWIQRIKPFLLKLEALSRHHFTAYVGYIDFEGTYEQDGVAYYFCKPHSRRPFFPRQLHKIVKELQPDVVVVAGFLFPFQVIQLRRSLGKNVIIAAQHHADKPGGWKRTFLQRIADRSIDSYLFSARGNATPWVEAGIVPEQKVHVVPEAATSFKQKDKQESRRFTGIDGSPAFLWVGRLNANKDPLTVLTAFEQYAAGKPGTKLYMIYQEAGMLEDIRKRMTASEILTNALVLVGQIPHDQLDNWYSAADYFILASHSEGGNYALNEAMACGCVPVVSDIPASMNAIADGKAGYHFRPGDVQGLLNVLRSLKEAEYDAFSKKVKAHAEQHLTADAIAARLQEILVTIYELDHG
jgi:glycosyltransferase involved in cell wall biosynthesis